MDDNTARDSTLPPRRKRNGAARQQIKNALQEQTRLSELISAIRHAVTRSNHLSEALDRSANVVVQHLDAALARIWVLDAAGEALELRASAGIAADLDASQSRIPLGQFKIGRVAQDQRPYLTNEIACDSSVNDLDGARREGMVAFAAYPLLVADRLIGVIALFARHPLTETILTLLEVIASILALDIDRRQNEAALQLAAERLQLATESAQIGTWDLDPVTDTLFWDARCRAAFGYPLDLPIDYPTCLSLIHRDDRERTNAAVEAALSPEGTGNYAVEFRAIGYLDGIERWARVEGQAFFNESHTQALRFIGTIRDISEAKRNEQALHEARVRLDAALLAGNIGTWTWDIVQNRVFADSNLARLFSLEPREADGGKIEQYLNAIHPEDRERTAEIIENAVAHGDTFEAEYRVVLPDASDRWLVARGTVERDAEGNAISLPGVVLDITERVLREQREHFLAEITRQTYGLTDPEAVIARVVRMVGAFLKVDRCLFAQIDLPTDRAIIHEEYRSRESLPNLIGTLPFSAFGNFVVSECAAGRVVAVDDVRNDPVHIPPDTLSAYLSLGIAAHIAVPAIYGGALVGVLAVHRATPYPWRPEAIELLRTVVERMWPMVENARLNRETRLRTERELVLNQVGAAVRATLDTEAILQSTVALLGQGLHADRCHFVRIDPTRQISYVSPEWLRAEAGLTPLAGRTFDNTDYASHDDPTYSLSRTHVLNDVNVYGLEEAASFHAIQLRSRIRVPIEIGDQMASLLVAMGHTARVWTEDEVRLVENVASLVRSALEAAQAQQRERNIAQQLQDALIPPPPTDLPGLALQGYYKPALEEAGVGGDYYDVFPLDKERTALIVGDLNGKGLRAASEVATVRNMTRFALYSDSDIAHAVTGLSRILVEQELLSGFATMFVGVYDQTNRTLTYVNCGQEPALLWRAAEKSVEQLPPTGPVLGGFLSEVPFTQRQITLAEGDTFAVFTDGLTDVGPSRRKLLELSGVTDLFHDACALYTLPDQIVDSLVTGVNTYGRDGQRDDIALLIGVINQSL